jgi:four helix bundle protein
MFDFEKLELYQVIKQLNLKVLKLLKELKSDPYLIDQWKRATLSAMLNLAEGTGRMNKNDKKHFYTIARGSVFESVAILDLLHAMEEIPESRYQEVYSGYEQASKMLLAMYRSMNVVDSDK